MKNEISGWLTCGREKKEKNAANDASMTIKLDNFQWIEPNWAVNTLMIFNKSIYDNDIHDWYVALSILKQTWTTYKLINKLISEYAK